MPIRRLALVCSLSLAAFACSSNRDLTSPDAAGGNPGRGSGGVGGRETGGSGGFAGGGGGGATGGGGGGLPHVDAGMDMAANDGGNDVGNDAPADGGTDSSTDGLSDDAGPPLMAPAAFEVHGILTFKPSSTVTGPNPGLPTTQDLLLDVDPVTGRLIAAIPGQATTVPVTTTDRVHFATTTMLYFQLPTISCRLSVSYSSFNLTVQGGQVNGTASGTALVIVGDVGYSYETLLTFAGTLDTHGPSVTLPVAEVDPLYPPPLTTNEPLPSTAAAQLTSDADMVALEPRPGMSQVVTSFGVPAGRALRYGTTYRLTIAPWQDLAGNPGAPLGTFTTVSAPPLVAEDGFEGSATTVGGAPIVDASVLPPITGTRSAVLTGSLTSIPGSRRLQVRLPVQSGDTVVRFNLRPWGNFQGTLGTGNLSTTVAVPGGASTTKNMPGAVALSTMAVVGSNTVWLGEVMHVEIPLPAGASSEVVVDLNTGLNSSSCGLQPTNASFLVDDLRVE